MLLFCHFNCALRQSNSIYLETLLHIIAVVRQQFEMGINYSIFLYRKSFRANQRVKHWPWSPSNCTGFTLCNSAGLAVGECYAVKADSHVSGNRFRPKQKWTICYWRLFFMNVFIRRAPVKHNTASECIRTVAATCGCKILQVYEYDANVYGYNANCERHPKNTSSCSIQDSWLRGWGISSSI